MAAAREKPDQSLVTKTPKEEELSIIEKLNEFANKNRKSLFLALAVLIAILAGALIFLGVSEKLKASAFRKVDEFNQRYEALKGSIGSQEDEAASKQEETAALLEELAAFAARSSGFAAGRAYSISAEIYEAEKKWADAEKAWLASAKAAAKTYLAPVSLYRAAVASEEQENTESAIELYTRALNYDNAFSVAARAQFSVGRLEEKRNNMEAALAAYRNLISKWPNDTLWTNLAQSRIILLTDR